MEDKKLKNLMIVKRIIYFFLLVILLVMDTNAQNNKNPFNLEKYVSKGSSYVLYKPKSWTVEEQKGQDTFLIDVISPNKTSQVEFFYALNNSGSCDSLNLMSNLIKQLKNSYPDFQFSEISASQDKTRSVTTITYTDKGTPIKGRYYFILNQKFAIIMGYLAPKNQIEKDRSLLLNILSNLSFLPAQPPNTNTTQNSQNYNIQPINIALIPTRAEDNSCSISIPKAWNYQALKGKVLTSSPEGNAGFIATTFEVLPDNYGIQMPVGVIVSPYLPPAQFLGTIFSTYGTGRILEVIENVPDRQAMQDFPTFTGRQCEAADVVVRYISKSGTQCLGSYKLINSYPGVTGQWFSIVSGFWAPEAEFPRYAPLLEKIGASFSINDQYAKSYIQAGLANLRRLQQQTAQKMKELSQAKDQQLADWYDRQNRKDYMDSKWDDYRRGQSYWVSEMEGGKVYSTDSWGTTDTSTGEQYNGSGYNYINYEGQNPSYPSESMTEITSYDFNKYYR